MNFERAKKKISLRELWNNIDFNKPATWGLITANLSIIFYAFIDNLTATEVLWIYWIQSVIIGAFNFFRIITLKNFSTEGFKQNGKTVNPTRAVKVFTAIFFLFHYGFFHILYGVFLAAFPTILKEEKNTGIIYLIFPSIVFLINYGIEFYKEQSITTNEVPNLGTLMFMPYLRIIPMHLTIILGGFIAAAGSFSGLNTSVAVILLLMGLKTLVDLITHSVNPLTGIKTPEKN